MWCVLRGWRGGCLGPWGALGVQGPRGLRALASKRPRSRGEYSHVVVGAGSAGCVLAGRLTEDPDQRVLLLEAGPKDVYAGSKRLRWKIHMPAALVANLCDDTYNCGHPLHCAFLEAAQQAGYPLTEDMNGFQQEGFGWMDMTIHEGSSFKNEKLFYHSPIPPAPAPHPVVVSKRWSTACAYLHPALSRPNLTAETQTFVSRVLFEGTRAVGVEYIKNGQSHRGQLTEQCPLQAWGEDCLAGRHLGGYRWYPGSEGQGQAAWQHPRGPEAGVGQNLQDHLEIYIQQACTRPITLHSAQKPLRKAWIGLEWLWKFTDTQV
ncbi:CHDH [Cervus elaphus hippelaphus]|uniref:CHDH n=1 Tax=Cervus elaphus hippelaphus TaxID=46360 RepID=A0A212CAJ8_CEREH|nr:CHDH [Cervus elaphus hippelaphus]